MKQVLLPVKVIAPEVDETPLRGESPRQLVHRLSLAKALFAKEIALKQGHTGLVVAADTIVVSPKNKKVLGKPSSTTEAQKMLKLLSGKTHSVLTGYCILDLSDKKIRTPWVQVVESRVTIRKIPNQCIGDYIATGEPMDKAGSYGAQGIGGALIEKIEGSYTNVVGLPMTEILRDFETEFKIKLLS